MGPIEDAGASQNRPVYFVLSTHWDREWYESFQNYRFRLVRLMDSILEGLESGELAGPFQTDGQTIVLEDYLEIRPEKRAQVEQFVQEGKFKLGPWYVLPDEFLVSGESIIRNIELGRTIAMEFGGEPSKAGFICDLFGHISQLPQIFRNFGIKMAFLWRGVNGENRRHFHWKGEDGSQLFVYRFAHIGYCDYAFKVRDAGAQQTPVDAAKTRQQLEQYIQKEASETHIPPILLFDGADHCEWDRASYAVLRERIGQDVQHADLDAYVDAALRHRDSVTETKIGELYEPGITPWDSCHVIPGVMSSRVWIKQANIACQEFLCRWAEPWSVMAGALVNEPYPVGYLKVAWKHLIQNHPHDSICGCSIDQVHRDMIYRFDQCREIAERVVTEHFRKIAARIEGELNDETFRLVVFNPHPEQLEGPVDLPLEIPSDWPVFNEFFGFEKLPAFRLFGDNGEEIPYQRCGQTMAQFQARIYRHRVPEPTHIHLVNISVPLNIPSLGYTTIDVRAGKEGWPTRHPMQPNLLTGSRTAENEFLRIDVQDNGSINLTDKSSGEIYHGLNTFEDDADIGDGWYHGVAINDVVYASSGCQANIAIQDQGPQKAVFRIELAWELPAEFDFKPMRRTLEQRETLRIVSLVTLRKGSEAVEIRTTVYNTVKDHRLRVLFPAQTSAEHYGTDQAFDFVKRPIKLREDNHELMELDVETKPQQSFCAVADSGRGLAVAAAGLMESCVCDREEQPIAVTLMRCTRRTVHRNGEPDGQLQGEYTFSYAVTPYSGSGEIARIFRLSQRLNNQPLSIQMKKPDLFDYETEPTLPKRSIGLRINGDVIFSSFRKINGALQLRLFNPALNEEPAMLKFTTLAPRIKQAQEVDYRGILMGEPMAVTDGVLELKLAPKKILTLELKGS